MMIAEATPRDVPLFSYQGRLNRARYFWLMFGLAIGFQIVALFNGQLIGNLASSGQSGAAMVFLIAHVALSLTLILAMSCPVVKRLHDLGRPGRHYWLMLIPLYNLYLGFVLLLKKGQGGANAYGPDPLGADGTGILDASALGSLVPEDRAESGENEVDGDAPVRTAGGTDSKLGAGRDETAGGNPHPIAGMTYMEVPKPPGGSAVCSDDNCPCPEVSIPRGKGYMYVSEEVAKLRREYPSLAEIKAWRMQFGQNVLFGGGTVAPVLTCDQGAELRDIDKVVAGHDAEYWWETDRVPCRATPRS